jgi:acyl carrier protein
MRKKEIENHLLNLLKDFIRENEIKLDSEIDSSTRLIGSSSLFDSIELVSFIVEVEQFLEDELNIEIGLTTENAMSRRTSPFLSIEAMTNYIIEQINE